MEAKCKNCRLFNRESSKCGVAILYEGKQIHLPVDSNDDCFFENQFLAIDEKGNVEKFKAEVQSVKWYCVDPKTNKPAENGVVKIEYPEGFFGKEFGEEEQKDDWPF
jgi:hypothetical protein